MIVESMIERVARAIAGADPEQQGQIDDSEMGEYFWEKYRDHYVVLARAAIEAMREPTDAMVDVMNDVVIDGPAYVDFYPSMADCASLWTAGIDAALNEQVSG